MARNISDKTLIVHKDEALNCLNTYLEKLINSSDSKNKGKADKLSYWLKDWTTFLDFESRFSPTSLKRYKRGEILKIHLGYNIGSEEGGLHYAVVIEKNNSIKNPVITVVPLTSIKPDKDLSNLKSGEVMLGNEIFLSFTQKFNNLYEKAKKENLKIISSIKQIKKNADKSPSTLLTLSELDNQLNIVEAQICLLEKMKTEISKMKHGSIGLVNQIITISKIRIYDPKKTEDMFSGIVLSNEGLDKIDKEIIKKFTK